MDSELKKNLYVDRNPLYLLSVAAKCILLFSIKVAS